MFFSKRLTKGTKDETFFGVVNSYSMRADLKLILYFPLSPVIFLVKLGARWTSRVLGDVQRDAAAMQCLIGC